MRFLFILFIFGCLSGARAQQHQFVGTWQGTLKTSADLRLVFTISETDNQLSSTFQSIDQTEQVFATDTCYHQQDSIFIIARKFGISFSGKIINDTLINGVFVQGIKIPLTLTKTFVAITVDRPQTPQPPFPYHSEDRFFYNADSSIKFGATLTWPKIPEGTNYIKAPTYPAVVLISGSGPQDRDETIFNHKIFAVIADALTNQGLAVLRYDDRGVAQSTGNFATATSADFALDVKAALHYLKTLPQIDSNQLGLIGHSEGGMIAPMVAATAPDVKFMLLLAAPGIPIINLMKMQIETVSSSRISAKAAQYSAAIFELMAKEINKNKDSATTFKNSRASFEKWIKNADTSILAELHLKTEANRIKFIKEQLAAMSSPWFKYFLAFDPTPYLKKTTAKVLAINGSKDVQVLAEPNLQGIDAALKKSASTHFTTLALPGLNHLFQNCQTCTVAEYKILTETFSPQALNVMQQWLQKNVLTY